MARRANQRSRKASANRCRPRVEQLESRLLLAASPWHNSFLPPDVDADGKIAPIDALLVVNDLNANGSRQLVQGEGESPASGITKFVDVNGDQFVSPIDALQVINALNAEGEGGGAILSEADVTAFLARAAAASASEGAIIAIVDRGGRILGVRAEAGILTEYKVGAIDERTSDFVFAVDGAVAKARTAAFFANGDGSGVVGPLTSRTIRFVSQSTITQREVESNPSITDLSSTIRGPGFVAPIGLGGHFPPGVAHTPPVDLFAIEHTNRDSVMHAGKDAILGTGDAGEGDLGTRFGADYKPGVTIEAPESYGFVSKRKLAARPRGIATLPGGIPLYKADPATGAPTLVGGIGVFFPGKDGYATHEQGFVAGINQTELDRTNAPRVLESEWIAFAAACGSSGAAGTIGVDATVGDLDGVACPEGYDLPFGRIDLVGITLEIYGPSPTAQRPQPGIVTLLSKGNEVGIGDSTSGADQIVVPGDLYRAGVAVPKGWLVEPRDSTLLKADLTPEITAAEVRTIIENAITEADLVRAGIRLPIGSRTRMVFSVADREGNVLGLYRMPDATIFSIDVAVAKARNTAYHADDTAVLDSDRVDDNGDGAADANVPAGTAFTNRTFRFLSEPRYPSGVENSRPGAFSILLDPGIDPNTGENIGPALPASAYSASGTSVLGFDAFNPGRNFRDPDNIANQNGIVFFPGSAPLYKDGKLIGGFGASGDGVDQDDVVTFSATVGFEVPEAMRVDQFFVRDVRLPFQKFLRNPRG
ncbi:MAG: dockerin type I domain-containing protein [Planctomycetota bacterium]|nr:dockerin type I domain-containing protein [Planctomycetota bacterium]